MRNSREQQSVFRVGKYGITQVPLNIVVGEYKLVTTGVNIGTEKMSPNTKTFHKNYECALGNLLDRMIADKMSASNVDMIRGLIDSIKEAKEEIVDSFNKSL